MVSAVSSKATTCTSSGSRVPSSSTAAFGSASNCCLKASSCRFLSTSLLSNFALPDASLCTALSEVAELAGIESLQDQVERPRPDAGPTREGMAQGTDGEQHEPYNRRQGHHHQPVGPRALQPEEVGEAHRREAPEYQNVPEDSGDALLRRDQAHPSSIRQVLDVVEAL